jgi:hypothetical protein
MVTGMIPGVVAGSEGLTPLMPILQHFGMMQQQMMDQFQQMVMMMMQTMQQIHHEQTDLLRKEMEHLREVTMLLHEARLEFKAVTNSAAATANAPSAVPSPGSRAEWTPTPPPAMPAVSRIPPGRSTVPTAEPREVPFTPPHGTPIPSMEGTPLPVPPTPVSSASPIDSDVHGQLAGRIAELEQQRQNVWQRILGMLTPGT